MHEDVVGLRALRTFGSPEIENVPTSTKEDPTGEMLRPIRTDSVAIGRHLRTGAADTVSGGFPRSTHVSDGPSPVPDPGAGEGSTRVTGRDDTPSGMAIIPRGIAVIPAGIAPVPVGIGLVPEGERSRPPGAALVPVGIAFVPVGIGLVPEGERSRPPGAALVPVGIAFVPAEAVTGTLGMMIVPTETAPVPEGEGLGPGGASSLPPEMPPGLAEMVSIPEGTEAVSAVRMAVSEVFMEGLGGPNDLPLVLENVTVGGDTVEDPRFQRTLLVSGQSLAAKRLHYTVSTSAEEVVTGRGGGRSAPTD